LGWGENETETRDGEGDTVRDTVRGRRSEMAHERRRGDHGAVRREGQHRLPCTAMEKLRIVALGDWQSRGGGVPEASCGRGSHTRLAAACSRARGCAPPPRWPGAPAGCPPPRVRLCVEGGGGLYRIGKWPIKRHLRTIRPQSPNQKVKINRMSERETWTSFLSLRTDVRAWRGGGWLDSGENKQSTRVRKG
jgi:hypothetical protein